MKATVQSDLKSLEQVNVGEYFHPDFGGGFERNIVCIRVADPAGHLEEILAKHPDLIPIVAIKNGVLILRRKTTPVLIVKVDFCP